MKKYIFKISFFLISIFVFNVVVNAYSLGDIVTYKNNKYYVISDENNVVTLLKASPLTTSEVNAYGAGHVNAYSKMRLNPESDFHEKEAVNVYGYGGMAFYQNENCKVYNGSFDDGCGNSYNDSEIKYVVDSWADDNVDSEDLLLDYTGYSVRLLTVDDLTNNFGFEYRKQTESSSTLNYIKTEDTPSWVYKFNYCWLMTGEDDSKKAFRMQTDGILYSEITNSFGLVRPVITISKTNLDLKKAKKNYIINNDVNDIKRNQKYSSGDIVTYNGINFTILKNSNVGDDSIILIKSNPLTIDEVLEYGKGYINKGLENSDNPKNINGYGILAYYSSDNCKESDNSGCTNKYEDSDIKHIVDAWALDKLSINGINISSLNARIISKLDLENYLKYTKSVKQNPGGTSGYFTYFYPPDYADLDLSYCWTSFTINDDKDTMFVGDDENGFMFRKIYDDLGAICPIITIKKQNVSDNNVIVSVPDTKLYKGIMIVLSGFIIILLSVALISIRKGRYEKNE